MCLYLQIAYITKMISLSYQPSLQPGANAQPRSAPGSGLRSLAVPPLGFAARSGLCVARRVPKRYGYQQCIGPRDLPEKPGFIAKNPEKAG